MPIQQLNIWICEVCGKVETTLQEIVMCYDGVAISPNNTNWDYNKHDKLACPECLEKECNKNG